MGYKVEQHQIKRTDKEWQYCVEVTTHSAALYNAGNALIWESWNYKHGIVSFGDLDKWLKSHVAYKALPAKVAQLVLKQVNEGWVNWLKALKDWKVNPGKYKAKPKPPGHKNGGNLVKFNNQAIGTKPFKSGLLVPSRSPIAIPVMPGLGWENLVEMRIVPKTGCFNVEVVFDDGKEDWRIPDHGLGASIDLGLDNLAAITFSDPTVQPIAINGKPLKAINQWANKQNAKYRSLLPADQTTSHRLQAIWRKRNNQVKDYLHRATKRIVDELDDIGVTCVAIGKNEGWKDSINIGRKNNQKFVTIPHSQFVDMLVRKLEAVGITVKVDEESYTSKASFLDWDSIPTYQPGKSEKHKFSGERVKTKSYRSKDGSLINADVNGAFNIGRKVIPNYFGDQLKLIVEQNSGNVVAFPRRVTPFKKTRAKDISGSAYV